MAQAAGDKARSNGLNKLWVALTSRQTTGLTAAVGGKPCEPRLAERFRVKRDKVTAYFTPVTLSP